MCGIVCGITKRNILPTLLQGLSRLEYRGYDSAGVAVIAKDTQKIQCQRVKGKVFTLIDALHKKPMHGDIGIAHTRWATHGKPSKKNAHPHCSHDAIAVVHNGIIENHDHLYQKLTKAGYQFQSKTDTETIAHLLHYHLKSAPNALAAIKQTARTLKGAYALGIILTAEPHTLYAIRYGSPLIIGISPDSKLIASDPIALAPFTQQFIYLKEGDIARIQTDSIDIYNKNYELIQRPIQQTHLSSSTVSKGRYRHYMKKEIFEQPVALSETLKYYMDAQGKHATHTPMHTRILKKIKRIHIIACGTSYHAALIGRYWLENLTQRPTQVDMASEHLYRPTMIEPHTLLIALSQSGETADTLIALRQAKKIGYAATLAMTNAAHSTLAREADILWLTHAGIEIGVAATKTFTTQLLALLLFALRLQDDSHPTSAPQSLIHELQQLPDLIREILTLNRSIQQLAHAFADKHHALFLGRGKLFPIALEGALKLKEISYIHAEAYPAGELKHGPLALVSHAMPIVVVAYHDPCVKKLEANIQEVQSRGGQLYIFMDKRIPWKPSRNTTLIKMPPIHPDFAPIAYTIPLQLLAYHVAVLKGTNIDQPRNLAKSVTVE